ncbi:MAG: hypothetical protein ACD_62C00424G0004 [uncultured bacterium]|nr:MAG: hypothetical protein ACD_62C00424G0004 [uncultured bacterium]
MTMPTPKTAVPTKEAGLGYPTIEGLLETESFDKINNSFNEAYKKLEKIAADSDSGLKKKRSASKAMQAYELTTELLNELLKIKYQIVQMREAEAKGKTKK